MLGPIEKSVSTTFSKTQMSLIEENLTKCFFCKEPLLMSDLITLHKRMIFAASMRKQAFSIAESCVKNVNLCDHLVGGFIRGFPSLSLLLLFTRIDHLYINQTYLHMYPKVNLVVFFETRMNYSSSCMTYMWCS